MKTAQVAVDRPLNVRENRGLAPATPKVHALNPAFASEVGDGIRHTGRKAAAERPDPNEKSTAEGHRAVTGTAPATGQPIIMIAGIDRLAPTVRTVLARAV